MSDYESIYKEQIDAKNKTLEYIETMGGLGVEVKSVY